MSFERIDQYIKELEAIKNYEKVKAENASLLARVRELEELKVLAEGKTLKEAEESFLKAKEGEIREQAQKLFNQMKSEWERRDKPREVSNEALKWLKHTIEQLSKPEPRNYMKEVVEAGLPEKIEKIINSEVEKRINEEFLKRVDEESSKKALEKLEELKSVEWPNWYRTVVEPRIRQLESMMWSNVMKALEGPWIITCDKCGTRFQAQLTPEGIEELLRTGSVVIECPNPGCVDFILRHRIRIKLKQLIESKCLG